MAEQSEMSTKDLAKTNSDSEPYSSESDGDYQSHSKPSKCKCDDSNSLTAIKKKRKETDPRTELVQLAGQYYLLVQHIAKQFSYTEAEVFIKMLCGLTQATKCLASDPEPFTPCTTLKVGVPGQRPGTFSYEAVFLDTFSMNVCYRPEVFDDDDPGTNRSTVWTFTRSGSGFTISNTVTHTSYARLFESDGSWLNVTLTDTESGDPPPAIFTRSEPNADGNFSVTTDYEDQTGESQTYYLVAITAVKRQRINTTRQVVASLASDLNGRGSNTAIWSQDVFQDSAPQQC